MIEVSGDLGGLLIVLGLLGILTYITKCIITSPSIREGKELNGWLIIVSVFYILIIVGYLTVARYIIWI